VRGATAAVLQPATGPGLSRTVVADKLGALGGTAFHLGGLDTDGLAPGLHIPVSELKELRRTLVAELDAAIVRVDRAIAAGPLCASVAEPVPAHDVDPIVVPLCRTDAQLDAVLDAGAAEVELDWMELVGLGNAVERARRRGARVGIATLRVQKPDEDRIDQRLAKLAPDHRLIPSLGPPPPTARPRRSCTATSRSTSPTRSPLAGSSGTASPRSPPPTTSIATSCSRCSRAPRAAGSPSRSTTTCRPFTPSTASTRTCSR